MKKLILAAIALGLAMAISSCCDQSSCPSHMQKTQNEKGCYPQTETPYRWDHQEPQPQQPQPPAQPNQERQHRRW